MNKTKYLALAFAALTLGACTSDDVVKQDGPNWDAEGQGYVGLSIKLPTQPSSRANDKFDDGTPEEYDVKNATLILFSENKIVGAYEMTGGFTTSDQEDDNITSTAKITGLVGNQGGYDALVVLNHNNVFTLGDNGAITVGGTSMVGKSLDDFNYAISEAITEANWHKDGFLMSNAVLSIVPGGNTKPTSATAKTLMPIAANAIYETEAEANNNPAANIYVERAEAKVTLIDAIQTKTTTDGSDLSYTVAGWCLDNTNKTNKLVRTVNGFATWNSYATTVTPQPTDLYRFIGSVLVGKNVAGTESYYRVYWGDDYNYDNTAADALSTVGEDINTVNDDDLKKADGTIPDYCFENTTDLNNMREKNCTRVILKTVFNDGETFYIIDNNKSKTWTLENLEKEVASRLLSTPEFNAWATSNVEDGQKLSSDTDFDVTISTGVGSVTVTSIVLNDTGKAKLKDTATEYPTNAATLANNEITIACYADGVSYYSVWISHFGEDGTPWNPNNVTASDIYSGGEQNYLGRWGVLRNNWYEIQINSISSLGDPTVTTVTDETIDKKHSYVSANINILSWAKRTQDVEL